MIRRVPIYPDINRSIYNNGGLSEYTPYTIADNNRILIDHEWWNSLTPYIQELITKPVGQNIEYGRIQVPHEYMENDALLGIYQSYLDGYDYNIWYNPDIPNGPQNVVMIPIPKEVKEILMEIHYHGYQGDHPLILELRDNIKRNMDPEKEYFIRLSSTSGKNDIPTQPMNDPDEIVRHLWTNNIFIGREYIRDKPTYLIMIPWNHKIDKKFEFRIFVVNGKLTGACQQWWSTLFHYTIQERDTIQEVLQNIPFLNSVYRTFIADVYIDIENRKCQLIEFNPFGAHCGAGSGLFNWITDFDILYGLGPPELRYLSIINY
jgi:hypothetical protein